jgi:hypothetical protein
MIIFLPLTPVDLSKIIFFPLTPEDLGKIIFFPLTPEDLGKIIFLPLTPEDLGKIIFLRLTPEDLGKVIFLLLTPEDLGKIIFFPLTPEDLYSLFVTYFKEFVRTFVVSTVHNTSTTVAKWENREFLYTAIRSTPITKGRYYVIYFRILRFAINKRHLA